MIKTLPIAIAAGYAFCAPLTAPAEPAASAGTYLPAQRQAVLWKYVLQKPADGWFQPGFDDAGWKEAPAGFGSPGVPGGEVRTEWTTQEIWLRRSFELPAGGIEAPMVRMHHDEDAEVYVDGVLATQVSGFVNDYESVRIKTKARETLKPGKHVLAVHCKQTKGGQFIDVGLVDVQASN